MREGKIEKVGKKSSVLDRLQATKEEEEAKKVQDKLYRSPWEHIIPEDLIEENKALFDLFSRGEFEAAQVKALAVKEKIKLIKDESKRDSNERFLYWIDDKIQKELEKKQTKEFNQQDNT